MSDDYADGYVQANRVGKKHTPSKPAVADTKHFEHKPTTGGYTAPAVAPRGAHTLAKRGGLAPEVRCLHSCTHYPFTPFGFSAVQSKQGMGSTSDVGLFGWLGLVAEQEW
jgi:hypothetical protein